MREVQPQIEAQLLAMGYLNPEQLQQALELQANISCSLGKALWSLNLLTQAEFLQVVGAVTDHILLTDWLVVSGSVLDFSIAKAFEPAYLRQVGFFPCAWQDSNTLVVAVAEPSNPAVKQAIRSIWFEAKIYEVLATENQILNLVFEENLATELLDKGRLSLAQWQEAQAIQQRTGSPLGEILPRLGYLRPIDYLEILSSITGLSIFSRLKGTGLRQLDPKLMQRFDLQAMMTNRFLPLAWVNLCTIMVVVQDPFDLVAEAAIYAQFPGVEIAKVLGTENDITQLIHSSYQAEFSQQAVFHLLARSPKDSAAIVFTPSQIFIGYFIFALFLWSLAFDWWHTLAILITILNIFFAASVIFKLILSLIGAADLTHQITNAEVSSIDEQSLPIYSVLVPVYNEPEVTPILIEALSKLDYPHEKLDVLLLLEEKDLETIKAAQAANPPRYIRFIYIPDSQPKTKPKACNYGLAFARGEYLTIYDAEDIPDPDQLKKAVFALRNGSPNLVCVQAALNYYNRNENFLTRMFTLEYSYWFDYLLPGLETLGLPIPLGGTSNHFRTDRLRELGGWDPFNVTEDADLGIRASKRGYTVGVINSTTYEEANCELKNWIRQRSRWIKGYMQTWLVHNRHPWKSLKKLGIKSWLAYQFLIGGTVVIFLISPILWFLFIYWLLTRAYWLENLLPGWVLYISLFNLSISNALGVYLNMIAVFRRRYYKLLPYALLNPLYWQLHSVAAYLGLWQLFAKPFYWEKTLHGISKFTKTYLQFAGEDEARKTA
jgi:hypothetical protein